MAPAGDVYLVTSLRPAGKEDGQVALWNLSGAFPPQPVLTPLLDDSHLAPQAVFTGEREAVLAWARGDDIQVEAFALPES